MMIDFSEELENLGESIRFNMKSSFFDINLRQPELADNRGLILHASFPKDHCFCP
jgi:hypothetical protein